MTSDLQQKQEHEYIAYRAGMDAYAEVLNWINTQDLKLIAKGDLYDAVMDMRPSLEPQTNHYNELETGIATALELVKDRLNRIYAITDEEYNMHAYCYEAVSGVTIVDVIEKMKENKHA